MAAGRHIEIYKKNLNISRTVRPILIKFDTELRLDTTQTPEVTKPPFSKMAVDEKLKTTND